MSNRIILPDNHVSFGSSADIDAILAPLKKIGIYFFTYMRNYPNYTQLYLSNRGEWVRAYYDQRLYETSQFQLQPENYQSGRVIWPAVSDLPIYQYARESLRSDHGITIIKRADHYTEFYFFSTHIENSGIINVYLNNLEVLDRFVLYFNDKAEDIIKRAEKSKIVLPSQVYHRDNNNQETEFPLFERVDNVFQEMEITKYRIKNQKYNDVKLSSRELECIIHYHRGKSAKESAREMDISQRTVETYFENIKNKLGCYSKDQVVQILTEDGFF